VTGVSGFDTGTPMVEFLTKLLLVQPPHSCDGDQRSAYGATLAVAERRYSLNSLLKR